SCSRPPVEGRTIISSIFARRLPIGRGNCGNCDKSDHSCADGPCCDNWFLHKFRATFATQHLQSGVDLRTVQLWMGHKDLESTMRYLKPARGSGIRDKVNNTFKRPRPMLLRTGS